MLIHGNNLDELPKLADASIDAIITDPPYELGFMGKSWDSTGIAYNVQLWRECLRVLKPGGHLLAFSGSRTYHRMAVAIEDAGFEIRDQIMWVYGSGFPKSLDVSKAIDKQAGAQREPGQPGRYSSRRPRTDVEAQNAYQDGVGDYGSSLITVPATDAAKQWEGWGTALKPAHEPIVLARKPLNGTVANNVIQHGTGALNIDGCRVGDEVLGGGTMPDFRDVGAMSKEATGIDKLSFGQNPRPATRKEQPIYAGRWPANLIHDGSDEVLELFPDTGKSTGGRIGKKNMSTVTNVPAGQYEAGDPGYGDSGSAARFFYCAKASKRDRNEGLEHMPNVSAAEMVDRVEGSAGMNSLRAGAGRTSGAINSHPTVKPTELMRYLCRLITPSGGIILDPFTGSGSTGKAAILEGFNFIGIELDHDYIKIAEARINHAYTQRH
jgi:site-specific DNA-methyltransferase (adenine-specific)